MNGERRTNRILDRAGCLALLSTTGLGRVALSERAMPVIVPVRYELAHDAVTFPADEPSLRMAAESGHVVCFEADAVSADGVVRSVNVIGPLELDRGATESLGRNTTARLRTTMVRGRVLEPVH